MNLHAQQAAGGHTIPALLSGFPFRGVCALFAFTFFLAAGAFCSSTISSSAFQLPEALNAVPASTLTIADLDGDGQPDFVLAGPLTWQSNATLTSLRLQLTTGVPASLTLPASFTSLRVFARDVDSDLDLDLVVTAGWMDRLVSVWINDSHGGFTENLPGDFEQQFGHTSTRLLCPGCANCPVIALTSVCNPLVLDGLGCVTPSVSISPLRGIRSNQGTYGPSALNRTRAPPLLAFRSLTQA